MCLFLKDPWIERTTREQLQQDAKTRSIAQVQVSSHAQLIEVIRQRRDKSFEVCISDSKYFIVGVLMSGTVDDFHKEIDCEIRDIKGCYVVVDAFHYDFCYERGKFLIYIEKFTYCGGECDTYGDPMDINSTYFMKNLARSPLYASLTLDDLFIHRSAVEAIACQGMNPGSIRMLLEQSQGLCGEQCSVCANVTNPQKHEDIDGDGGISLENEEDILESLSCGIFFNDGAGRVGSERDMFSVGSEKKDRQNKIGKYHPVMGRVSTGKTLSFTQHSLSAGNKTLCVRRIYISESMYIEKINATDQDLALLDTWDSVEAGDGVVENVLKRKCGWRQDIDDDSNRIFKDIISFRYDPTKDDVSKVTLDANETLSAQGLVFKEVEDSGQKNPHRQVDNACDHFLDLYLDSED